MRSLLTPSLARSPPASPPIFSCLSRARSDAALAAVHGRQNPKTGPQLFSLAVSYIPVFFVLQLSPSLALPPSLSTKTKKFGRFSRSFTEHCLQALQVRPLLSRSFNRAMILTHASSLLQKEKAGVVNALTQLKLALKSSQKALEQKNIALIAMLSSLAALERQVSGLKAEIPPLKDQSQELRQNAFSAPHKITGKKIVRRFAKTAIFVPVIFVKVNQGLPAWLAEEGSEFYLDIETLTRSYHSRSEQSHQYAVRT